MEGNLEDLEREFGPGLYDIHITSLPQKDLPPGADLARMRYGDFCRPAHSIGGRTDAIFLICHSNACVPEWVTLGDRCMRT